MNEPYVTIRLPKREAEKLSHGLSDIACWARGFVAALPESSDRHPLGIEEVRALNIILKRGLEEIDPTTED